MASESPPSDRWTASRARNLDLERLRTDPRARASAREAIRQVLADVDFDQVRAELRIEAAAAKRADPPIEVPPEIGGFVAALDELQCDLPPAGGGKDANDARDFLDALLVRFLGAMDSDLRALLTRFALVDEQFTGISNGSVVLGGVREASWHAVVVRLASLVVEATSQSVRGIPTNKATGAEVVDGPQIEVGRAGETLTHAVGTPGEVVPETQARKRKRGNRLDRKDREILCCIANGDAWAKSIAAKVRISPESVRRRIGTLRKRGLISADSKPYLLTSKGHDAARRQKGSI